MTSQEQFINQIAPYQIKWAKQYGYKCVSAAIAQACLESGYGTSNKAKHNNYYGLKYREGRVTCNSGTFVDGGSEQNPDGSYVPITDQWYEFADMDHGVEGYYQFLNIPNYAAVKQQVDPKRYLEEIKKAGYATSLSYVDNVYDIVVTYNLTKYDRELTDTPAAPTTSDGYTNSSFATTHVDLNKNSNPRNAKYADNGKVYNPTGAITVITPHHMAGVMTAKACAEYHQRGNSSSANYYIGKDGDICLGVEEKYRAWTSGSRDNDSKAITIEVSNDGGAPDWHVSDKSLESLINLCVDICQRNKIKQLNFTGDATGSLTMHCYFQATACPGPYLKSKFPYIADEVNKRLNKTPAVNSAIKGNVTYTMN